MTIERPWWPSGGSGHTIDKHQANILISLAIEIDKIDVPHQLDLHLQTDPLTSEAGPARMYRIGKVNSETYRKYCEHLWNRCSHGVKFLYMICGMIEARDHLAEIIVQIEKLKHPNQELREDWHKVWTCLKTAAGNLNRLKRKTLIDSILPQSDTGKAQTAESLHVEKEHWEDASNAIPSTDLPIIPEGMEVRLGVHDITQRLAKYYKEQRPLPKPNIPKPKMEPDASAETLADIGGTLSNPMYAGTPPFPRIISDELWVYANARLITEIGAEQWLVNMLFILREIYGQYFEEKPGGKEEDQEEGEAVVDTD